MKNLRHWSLGFGTLTACFLSLAAYAQQNPSTNSSSDAQSTKKADLQEPSFSSPLNQTLKVGIVNTKKCLENSKLGKLEQANFEKMKNQMESILQEKEKTLEDIESKLNDDDYMDSISDEAASELKRKKRNLRNEGMQLQNQYLQTLQQANLKIVQKLTEAISKASDQVAKEGGSSQSIDIIFTDEACTYSAPHLDVSDRIIAKMNTLFDAEQKDNKDNAPKR